MDQDVNHIQGNFDQDADLPIHQREVFVHDLCKGDRDLDQRILELLGHLPRLPAVKGEEALELACSCLLGDRLGRYTIKKELGRDGGGVVYLASKRNPSSDVRIKMILPKNTTGSSRFIDRFYREQELRVRLDHPCITSFNTTNDEELPHPLKRKPET